MRLFLSEGQNIIMKEFDTSRILSDGDTGPTSDHLKLIKSIPGHSSNLLRKLVYYQVIDGFIKRNFNDEMKETDYKLLKLLMGE